MQIYEEEKNEESEHPSINVSIDVFEVLQIDEEEDFEELNEVPDNRQVLVSAEPKGSVLKRESSGGF